MSVGAVPLMCARCKRNIRSSQMTGCLCDKCEEIIEGMTQQELDADWEAHQGPRPYKRNDTQNSRYYPDKPPALEGETDANYTDRLTGADGTNRRPFDHPRRRQCSIGWHNECSDRENRDDGRPSPCECPCHSVGTTTTSLQTQLAAEIRRHVSPGGIVSWLWFYAGERDAYLPEALAADLIAAGWVRDERTVERERIQG